jgi:hypothetical protein
MKTTFINPITFRCHKIISYSPLRSNLWEIMFGRKVQTGKYKSTLLIHGHPLKIYGNVTDNIKKMVFQTVSLSVVYSF